MENNVLIAFLLSLAAGLSTGIGGAIGIFAKRSNTKFLTFALGLSAGVMVYISFIEMMPESLSMLETTYGLKGAKLVQLLSFFAGMLLIAIIDKAVPESNNPHEAKNWNPQDEGYKAHELEKTGILTGLAIAIHNFPEGMASFVAALRSPSLAIPIVFAIAIHNIPEGVAVSAPIYFATGNKRRAFMYPLISGLAEPIGALFAWLVLAPFMSDTLYGILYAMISGIMVFISFDELLPSAGKYGYHHVKIAGVMLGMAIMAVSLLLFI